jgi:hypothetical protein
MKMAKVNITQAKGKVLNYLVATVAGYTNLRRNVHEHDKSLLMDRPVNDPGHPRDWFHHLNYTTNPLQSWPIIESERISIVTKEQGWIQTEYPALAIHGGNDQIMVGGNNHLEAAMRAHAIYHLIPLGFDIQKRNFSVEIPDHILELLGAEDDN